MTKVDEAIKRLRSLLSDRSEGVAAMMLMVLADNEKDFDYSPEELEELDIAEAVAARGGSATDEQIRAIWAKHGLSRSSSQA